MLARFSQPSLPTRSNGLGLLVLPFVLLTGQSFALAPMPGKDKPKEEVLVPTFVITSITYTDTNGKDQTLDFDPKNEKLPTVPAAALEGDKKVVVKGTYSPQTAAVSVDLDIWDGNLITVCDLLKADEGKWHMSQDGKKLKAAVTYTVKSNKNKRVDGIDVSISPVKFATGNPK